MENQRVINRHMVEIAKQLYVRWTSDGFAVADANGINGDLSGRAELASLLV